MGSPKRLDTLVVEHGLADTRARARALILAGRVRVGEEVATKAGASVPTDAPITLVIPDHPYVGRGGVKLTHAIEALSVHVRGRVAIDIGASTGGFTDALLQCGARAVAALDVGRAQLAWKLRGDERVVVLEGINARYLTPDRLPPPFRPADLVTIDVSFISVTKILPVVPAILAPDGDVIVLVKPQFEAGRPEIGKRGVVHDGAVHHRVVEQVAAAGDRLGLTRVAMTPSPIVGAEGNREFFLHLRPAKFG